MLENTLKQGNDLSITAQDLRLKQEIETGLERLNTRLASTGAADKKASGIPEDAFKTGAQTENRFEDTGAFMGMKTQAEPTDQRVSRFANNEGNTSEERKKDSSANLRQSQNAGIEELKSLQLYTSRSISP